MSNDDIRSSWYLNHDTLVDFAYTLHAVDAFANANDAIRFFEKPWKYTDEYLRYVEEDEPEEPESWTDDETGKTPEIRHNAKRWKAFAAFVAHSD